MCSAIEINKSPLKKRLKQICATSLLWHAGTFGAPRLPPQLYRSFRKLWSSPHRVGYLLPLISMLARGSLDIADGLTGGGGTNLHVYFSLAAIKPGSF